MRNPSQPTKATPRLGPRLGLIAVGLLVLVTGVLLPFAVGSALHDLAAPPTPRLYRLGPSQQPAPQHLRIHLIVTALDVAQQQATIVVTAYQVCPAACTDTYELLLISAFAEGRHDEGVPPSATVRIPAQRTEINETITLPVQGTPIRYPFDTYDLNFGAVLMHESGTGAPRPLTPAEAEGHVFLTLQEKVQALDTSAPRSLSADSIPVVGTVYPFLVVNEAAFARPFYQRVLTVLLVLLVAAAAAYAVLIRPVDQIMINAGALMLGIWGVRSILVVSGGPTITAVDLALSLVMLFLLAAIAVRTLIFLYARSGLDLFPALRRRSRAAAGAPGATAPDTPSAAPHPPSTADPHRR